MRGVFAGILAALREVSAQAGLEDSAGVVLVVSAAACQVIPSNELQHVGGERVSISIANSKC